MFPRARIAIGIGIVIVIALTLVACRRNPTKSRKPLDGTYCEHGLTNQGGSRGGDCVNLSIADPNDPNASGTGITSIPVLSGPSFVIHPDGAKKGKYNLLRDNAVIGSLEYDDDETVTVDVLPAGRRYTLTNHAPGLFE